VALHFLGITQQFSKTDKQQENFSLIPLPLLEQVMAINSKLTGLQQSLLTPHAE
jgi:hypothetical protein